MSGYTTLISKIIKENNEHKSYSINGVKIILQNSGGLYLVADHSGALPLIITPEYQQILDVDSIYHLFEVRYRDGKLVMNDHSYAENAQMNRSMIMVLESIGNIGLTVKSVKASGYPEKKNYPILYRKACFKDEYKTVSLTVYEDDIKIFDSLNLNLGKIYKIQNFIRNGAINITWDQGKTELEEISLHQAQTMKLTEYERSRIQILFNLKSESEFTGYIVNYTNLNYYYTCKICGRLVSYKPDLDFLETPVTCFCGAIIRKTSIETKFDVKLIFCNQKHTRCYIVLAFSDEILESLRESSHIKTKTDVEFKKDKEEEHILQNLVGLTARVMFMERKYPDGKKTQLIMKDMFLIGGENEFEAVDDSVDIRDFNWIGSYTDGDFYARCLIDEERRRRRKCKRKDHCLEECPASTSKRKFYRF